MSRHDYDELSFEVRISNEIKHWMENLIVPLLVQRYLEQQKSTRETPVVQPRVAELVPTVPDKLLVTKKEAARTLSVSVRTLDHMISRKEIPVKRIGRRVLVPVRALQQLARPNS